MPPKPPDVGPLGTSDAQPGKGRADELFPHTPGVVGETAPRLGGHGAGEPRLDPRACRLGEPEPESEKGVSDPVGRALGVLRRGSERDLAPDELHLDQTGDGTGEGRRRLPEAPRGLREPVAPRPDEREDRGRLRRVAEVVEKEGGRLVPERSRRSQHEIPDRGPRPAEGSREFPVARNASPHGVRLDPVQGIADRERVTDPAGGKRGDAEDLLRAPEERGGPVEDESLHHA